jgi:hypothetical protein
MKTESFALSAFLELYQNNRNETPPNLMRMWDAVPTEKKKTFVYVHVFVDR